jgi:hypothetical protein
MVNLRIGSILYPTFFMQHWGKLNHFPDLFDPSARDEKNRLPGVGIHRKTARTQPR